MAQQSLIYSFVARGIARLAEYSDFVGNFSIIALMCLRKLPSSNHKFIYTCDGYNFHYLVADGFTYCVVAVESAGLQIPIACLERIKDDFFKRYGGGKAATAASRSIYKEFRPKLKEHMQYCIDHPEEASKLAKVKAEISETKEIMMENVEKILDRGVEFDVLVDRAENLRMQARDDRIRGAKKRKVWLQNMKISLMVLAVIVALILIIVLSVCRGFSCGG